MPPNAKDSQELARATLSVWGTCSSVSANRTYLTIVQPLVRCEVMVKTKSRRSKLKLWRFNLITGLMKMYMLEETTLQHLIGRLFLSQANETLL